MWAFGHPTTPKRGFGDPRTKRVRPGRVATDVRRTFKSGPLSATGVFCPKCKSLLTRSSVRGKLTQYCPTCDGKGSADEPVAWWQKKQSTLAGAPSRASDAARAAASAQPSVPTGGARSGGGSRGRAKADLADTPQRRREPLPPPDKIAVPPGMDLFPWPNVREGQRQFIEDVATAAKNKQHLLAHAPTGLGKTVSTLAPLVAYALEHEKRVFFLTSKQSQHKIAVDTLKAIRDKAGVPFVVSDIISKQDMCPRREAREMFPKKFSDFCKREQTGRSCDYWETANGEAVKTLKLRVRSVEELVMTCTDHTVCPHNSALDLAAQAHVVVCDYNYFFSDLREAMQERLKFELSDIILVVDEAHNLPDRIRDHLSLTLDSYLLENAINEAKMVDDDALVNHLGGLEDTLANLAAGEADPDAWFEESRSASKGERYVSKADFVEAVNNGLSKKVSTLFHTDYEGLLEELKDAAARYEQATKADPEGLSELAEFLNNWRFERRGLARVLTTDPVPRLSYKMLDASLIAKPVFDGVHASVVMSGTLHPMEMTRDVLGLDPKRTQMREYRSPFPRENRLVLIDSSVTTGYKERTPEMFSRIGEQLAGIAIATPGNVAAFFPSYHILEQVRPHVEFALGGHKNLIVEERGLDKSEKEALITKMRRQEVADALLIGVQGGSLSEGYDYEDNLLKGVIIVGLPFAAPTLDVEALISYYDKKFGAGKGRPYGYVHPAFHRVLQAAGRSIRSPDDKGVIILMDKRFGWGSYRASYPQDFDPAQSADPVEAVKRFWGRL